MIILIYRQKFSIPLIFDLKNIIILLNIKGTFKTASELIAEKRFEE